MEKNEPGGKPTGKSAEKSVEKSIEFGPDGKLLGVDPAPRALRPGGRDPAGIYRSLGPEISGVCSDAHFLNLAPDDMIDVGIHLRIRHEELELFKALAGQLIEIRGAGKPQKEIRQ